MAMTFLGQRHSYDGISRKLDLSMTFLRLRRLSIALFLDFLLELLRFVCYRLPII